MFVLAFCFLALVAVCVDDRMIVPIAILGAMGLLAFKIALQFVLIVNALGLS